MKAQKTTLIFDLDGTLIDSSASILAGFAAALREHKIEPQRPLTADIIGPPLKEALALLAGTREAATIDRLAASFKAYYDSEGYKATEVFAGVDSMLRELHGRALTLHIATNKRLLPTRLILDHLHWTPLFTTIYALDCQTPAFANKAAMVAGQLARQNIEKATAAYVGDRPEDGQAADANGLDFYAAEWGYSTFPAEEWQAHWHRLTAAGDLPRQIANAT